MSHPRDIEQALFEIHQSLVTVTTEASKILFQIKEQLESTLAKWYAVNQAEYTNTFLSESAPLSKDQGEVMAKNLNTFNNEQIERNKEIMNIQKSLELIQGTEASPETVKQLSENLDKLSEHSKRIAVLQSDLYKKTMDTGFIPSGTNISLVQSSLDRLKEETKHLYEQASKLKQELVEKQQAQMKATMFAPSPPPAREEAKKATVTPAQEAEKPTPIAPEPEKPKGPR